MEITKEMNRSKVTGMIKMLPMLEYAFPEIKNAYYLINSQTREEYVTVCFERSDKTRGAFDVCVSCDSVQAMYDDVWKACKRRFG